MKKKICKKYGWILIWGLVSIVFAAVLQFLFSLEAPIPFLQAKWSAGDILTYSSTILLGLLALWQNQRFKNENDATQEKLEALSTRANELQITSKLIEHESERINLLRTQFQTFFDACACNYLVADYKDTAKGEKPYAYYSILRSSQIRTSYLDREDGARTRKFKSIWDNKALNNQAGTQEVKALLKGDIMSFPKSKAFIQMVCQLGGTPDAIPILVHEFNRNL